jgi:hypothetical protein
MKTTAHDRMNRREFIGGLAAEALYASMGKASAGLMLSSHLDVLSTTRLPNSPAAKIKQILTDALRFLTAPSATTPYPACRNT